jgi:hypothetical protein
MLMGGLPTMLRLPHPAKEWVRGPGRNNDLHNQRKMLYSQALKRFELCLKLIFHTVVAVVARPGGEAIKLSHCKGCETWPGKSCGF